MKIGKTSVCIVGGFTMAAARRTYYIVGGLCRKMAKDAKRHVQAAAIKLLPLVVIWRRSSPRLCRLWFSTRKRKSDESARFL